MKRLIAAAALMLMTGPAVAIDLDDMTDAERTAFRAEVRSYLLENPEVLMEAIAVFEDRVAASEAEAAQMALVANADLIFNSQFDWVGGNPDGDIVLVEFLDYRCGFCRRAHPEIDALIERDGNIRLVVKEFPILGDQSTLASRFAIATRIALGDDAYLSMHNALMEMRGDVSQPALAGLASANGLDPAQIFAAMNDPLIDATISTNRMLAQRLGITGTPSFIFDDQLVRGFVPLDGMIEIVAALRDTAP
jgi:protein-disulfide isomerase